MKKFWFFWVGFADLMTSLFFIMLVLYVVSFTLFKVNISELNAANEALDSLIQDLKESKEMLLIQAEKAKIIEDVEKNLEPLIENSTLFKYEERHKRFTLGFKVNFNLGETEINSKGLKNSEETIEKISIVGSELQKTVDLLIKNKIENPSMNNVSYLVIIAGYSSELINEEQYEEYERSYRRAYNLWDYWRGLNIDFESEKYDGLIDLQISGNGWGGVGRFTRDPDNFYKNEANNQRFIIQIVPKIGKTIK